MPDSISYEEGALLEPLTVSMYAIELSELKPQDNIAILGCGPIGITTLRSAVNKGVNKIFVTDLMDSRLKLAKKHKNVTGINASKQDPVKTIKKLAKGQGVDVVFEAAGSFDTVNQSVELAKIGGKVIIIGIFPEDYVVTNHHVARRKELVIKFVRRSKYYYEECINLVASGEIIIKDMITHVFKLKDIQKAFNLLEGYKDGVMKAIIRI